MDKASDYESGDCRFESWRGRLFFLREKKRILAVLIRCFRKKIVVIRSSLTKLLKTVLFCSNLEQQCKNRVINQSLTRIKNVLLNVHLEQRPENKKIA